MDGIFTVGIFTVDEIRRLADLGLFDKEEVEKVIAQLRKD